MTEPIVTATEHQPVVAGNSVTNRAVDAESRAMNSAPSEFRVKVLEVIEIIRPIIQSDHGDILLKDINESAGIVSVVLVGACTSCPASTQTLKAGVERILKDRVPGITQLINVADTHYEGTPVSL